MLVCRTSLTHNHCQQLSRTRFYSIFLTKILNPTVIQIERISVSETKDISAHKTAGTIGSGSHGFSLLHKPPRDTGG